MQLNKLGGTHKALLAWAKEYGPVFKFFLGRYVLVVISGARSWGLGFSQVLQPGWRAKHMYSPVHYITAFRRRYFKVLAENRAALYRV